MPTTLELLKETRALLDAKFTKWRACEVIAGETRYCHIGAVEHVCGAVHKVPWEQYADVIDAIDNACRALHPELRGQSRPRGHGDTWEDHFDSTPGVFVNNQLGKEAILAAYDHAIAQLEGEGLS